MNALVQPLPSARTRRLKRLAKPLIAPQVFDFWASRINSLWSWERPLARVVGRQEESVDAVTLWLRPNRHWTGFMPGQHVNLGVEVEGIRLTRSYSLTQPPRADGCIAVTIKNIEGGRLSQHLCRDAKVGDVFDLGPAFGEMTLPPLLQDDLLLLAAGSGITPLVCLVRSLAVQGMPVPTTLLYWARTREELCFADELRGLARTHPLFDVHFLLTREPHAGEAEASGRIDHALLESRVGDLSRRQVMACGPGGFVDSARALIASRSLSFQAEAFTAPPRAFSDTGDVQVTLAASGRTLTLPRGESLLKGLEAHGLRPASGCRMGICNTCSCAKTSGVTRHLHTGALVDEPVSALKLCISSAVTDLVLDL